MAEASMRVAERLIGSVPRSLLLGFAGIGLFTILRRAFHPIGVFWNYACSVPDYARRYGKGSYALVTGASDGIGEALVYEFAKMGFNLVLVGRSEAKLIRVKMKCVQTWNVSALVIVEDLATTDTCVFERIALLVKDLDVSILVNNAGFLSAGPFLSISAQDICTTMSLNCLSHTLLTHSLLPQLLSRPSRSLIICTSSIAGVVPVGYAAVYSASKAYLRMLFLALGEEVRGKIDVFVATPGRIRTKMIGDARHLPSVISVDTAVQGILRDASRKRESFCSFTHFWRFFKVSERPVSEQVTLFSPLMHSQALSMQKTEVD